MYGYLLWLGVFVFIPFVLLFTVFRDPLASHWRVFPLAATASLVVSIPWDRLAIEQGIWYFPESSIMGLWFLGLPLEEYLFIIFVTVNAAAITIIAWERYGEPL